MKNKKQCNNILKNGKQCKKNIFFLLLNKLNKCPTIK